MLSSVNVLNDRLNLTWFMLLPYVYLIFDFLNSPLGEMK